MLNDPYETLGLTSSATAAEIKSAYRKLVRTNHPDLHPGDPAAEARFKAVAAAYDILKDPETRARFDAGEIDALGAERPKRQYYRDFADAPDNAYRQTGGTYHRGRGFGADVDPADIFADILRNRGRAPDDGFGSRGFQAPGPDLRYALAVPFLDAARGAVTQITLPDGQSLGVTLPPGTADGQTLRLRGKGAPGFGGGPAGDALITVQVGSHPVFRRDGDDILVTLPITIDEAVLGGKVTVPTIEGPVALTIPAGASTGRILRLRGRGVAHPGHKAKGDQKVELKIVAPPAPDQDLRDFLAEWRKTHSHDPRGDLMKGAAT